MPLPLSLIHKIDVMLGVPGQQHFSDIPHERLATQATVWELPSGLAPGLSGRDRISEEIEEMRSNIIDSMLADVRLALESEPAIAYKSIAWWVDVYNTLSRRIVVMSSQDQFDILPNELGAAPHSDWDYYAVELKKYDAGFGIDITGAGHQVIEFVLKRKPVGREAKGLSDRMLKFAPDIIHGGGMEITQIDFHRHGGRLALWWD